MLARAIGALPALEQRRRRARTTSGGALPRRRCPPRKQRGDPRRLALLWQLWPLPRTFRCGRRRPSRLTLHALRYQPRRRLAWIRMLDWALILGSRPADEALRMLDELAEAGRPGLRISAAPSMLAMLGRLDEAWPLAEARANHLREVTGSAHAGANYLASIAIIEGDRERACRHHRRAARRDRAGRRQPLPRRTDCCSRATSATSAATTRPSRCSSQAQAVPQRSGRAGAGPSRRGTSLAERGELEQAEALARMGIAAAGSETDNSLLQAGATRTSPPCSSAQDGSTRRTKSSSAPSRSGNGRAASPARDRIRAQIDSLGHTAV